MVVAFSSKRIKMAASFFVALFFIISFSSFEHSNRLVIWKQPPFRFNGTRKLLEQARNETVPTTMKEAQPSQLEGCSPDYIAIHQEETAPLPNGIPTYTVLITNQCVADSCRIGNIHLACGSYSSARLVNPRIFRRIKNNDCLVNDGQPIAGWQTVSFQYANSYRYPLSLSSATCL